jgi:fatty-acyl-CoA synthase
MMLVSSASLPSATIKRAIETAPSAPPDPPALRLVRLVFAKGAACRLSANQIVARIFADRDRRPSSAPPAAAALLEARQGVTYPVLDDLIVADPASLAPVPADGTTMGEIFMRGNIVMKGYLKNPRATDEAFAGGWFHSGDLGVMHPDGYIELKDRSKDIIISGGENISTIEVEDVLYRHPCVLEAAVVARPDPMWGETPRAFVTVKPEASATAEEIIAFCRERLAHFKAPRTVIFGPLPKTSTGKIQKFLLRERAKGNA